MKKTVSILLLAVFFLFQAGRILLYFECRFSNSITTSSCDCAQILTDVKTDPGSNSIPANSHSNHRHLPEEFEMQYVVTTPGTSSIACTTAAGYADMTGSEHCREIFHPPLV